MSTSRSQENRVRREVKAKGYLLRRNRTRNHAADNYGLYLLIGDSAGNRRPGAAAAPNAFRRGAGATLAAVEAELSLIHT